jgi:hypothetical protein
MKEERKRKDRSMATYSIVGHYLALLITDNNHLL